jgi:hypothetical protein
MVDDATKPIVYYERSEDEEHDVLGKPLRVVAKLRNNRLIRAREELGLMSAKAAADRFGIDYGRLVKYEGLKEDPWSRRRSDWKEGARQIADAYGYHPEELWPEVTREVQRTTAILEVGAVDVPLALAPSTENADLDLAIDCRRALMLLSPREAAVIRRRFGIDNADGEQTLDETAAGIPSQAASTLAHARVLIAAEVVKAQEEVDSYTEDARSWRKSKAVWKAAVARLRTLASLAACISYTSAEVDLLPSPPPHSPSYFRDQVAEFVRALHVDPERLTYQQRELMTALRRLSEVAKLGVSRERVRGIETGALWKLRSSKRSHLLEPYVETLVRERDREEEFFDRHKAIPLESRCVHCWRSLTDTRRSARPFGFGTFVGFCTVCKARTWYESEGTYSDDAVVAAVRGMFDDDKLASSGLWHEYGKPVPSYWNVGGERSAVERFLTTVLLPRVVRWYLWLPGVPSSVATDGGGGEAGTEEGT